MHAPTTQPTPTPHTRTNHPANPAYLYHIHLAYSPSVRMYLVRKPSWLFWNFRPATPIESLLQLALLLPLELLPAPIDEPPDTSPLTLPAPPGNNSMVPHVDSSIGDNSMVPPVSSSMDDNSMVQPGDNSLVDSSMGDNSTVPPVDSSIGTTLWGHLATTLCCHL